jgi:hypothetical protein
MLPLQKEPSVEGGLLLHLHKIQEIGEAAIQALKSLGEKANAYSLNSPESRMSRYNLRN